MVTIPTNVLRCMFCINPVHTTQWYSGKNEIIIVQTEFMTLRITIPLSIRGRLAERLIVYKIQKILAKIPWGITNIDYAKRMFPKLFYGHIQ